WEAGKAKNAVVALVIAGGIGCCRLPRPWPRCASWQVLPPPRAEPHRLLAVCPEVGGPRLCGCGRSGSGERCVRSYATGCLWRGTAQVIVLREVGSGAYAVLRETGSGAYGNGHTQ